MECGRGGGKGLRLSAPALLTLAAEEVASGEDLEPESIEQLVLLRRTLRAAAERIDYEIDQRANKMKNTSYRRSLIQYLRKQLPD